MMRLIKKRTISLLPILLVLVFIQNAQAQGPDFKLRLNQLESTYTEEDISVEIEFGRNLAARILSRFQLVKDDKLQGYVTLLGSGIAAQVGRPELQFYFGVIDTDEINAYACPGGYIFITKGAISLMENEAQLAGVLAHEIWHINFRHVVKPLKIRATGDSVTSGIATAIGGTTAVARILLDQLTEQGYKLLFEEGISKEAELETDAAAIESLVTIGYDWTSYKDYIQQIDSDIHNAYREVLSKTHPDISQRLASMEKFAETLRIKNVIGKKNAIRYESYSENL
jgi:predicted Zn-dependent protease